MAQRDAHIIAEAEGRQAIVISDIEAFTPGCVHAPLEFAFSPIAIWRRAVIITADRSTRHNHNSAMRVGLGGGAERNRGACDEHSQRRNKFVEQGHWNTPWFRQVGLDAAAGYICVVMKTQTREDSFQCRISIRLLAQLLTYRV